MSYKVEYVYVEGDWRDYTELRIYRDGVQVSDYSDGGEAEDNSFGRDWRWVLFELKKAYEKGLEDGRAEGD